jgi:hypothetical protein
METKTQKNRSLVSIRPKMPVSIAPSVSRRSFPTGFQFRFRSFPVSPPIGSENGNEALFLHSGKTFRFQKSIILSLAFHIQKIDPETLRSHCSQPPAAKLQVRGSVAVESWFFMVAVSAAPKQFLFASSAPSPGGRTASWH